MTAALTIQATLRVVLFSEGDEAVAQAAQTAADAAAKKAATMGQSFDNPNPVGTHSQMQSLGAGQQATGVAVFEVPAGFTGPRASFGDGTVFTALQ